MTYETPSSFQIPEPFYTTLFEALAGNNVLLRTDTPLFTILAASPRYLQQTDYKKEALLGKGIFEAFPGSTDPNNTGTRDLLVSLNHVLEYKESHQLPVQRYDTVGEDGQFVERYWRAINKPVFSADGEVAYIIHSAEDITAEVKAKQREVQIDGIEKAYNLFMQVPAIISVTRGPEHILELANEGAVNFWGKGKEIVGKPLAEAIPEIRGQGIVERFDEVIKTGKHFLDSEVLVSTYRTGTKEDLYFDAAYKPYYEKNSTVPAGVFAISHEVTELVNAKRKIEVSEAALRQSEDKFRTMAESTPVLIAVGDESGNITYYNKAWTELTGRTMQDLLQSNWADLIYVEDRAQFVRVFMDAFATKEPFAGEFRLINAQGAFRWLLAHGVPRFDLDGNFLGYIAACTDITENKISEQALQTALEQVRLSKEAAELGTFDLDLEKGSMHWDDRCRILFGISHHNAVTYDKDFAGGLHPDDRDRILKVIDRLFIKSISNGDYDVEYRTVGAEDGVIRWVRAKGKVYFNSNDQPVRFIGSVLDITEKVNAIQKIENLVEERTKELAQANETLQNINKELQRSNQNLEEFAHAASHDLKEPVRKIHFFTHQLKEQLSSHLKEPELRSFSRIENASLRMGNLIDDLLLYSHVSQRPHDTEVVDLNQKVKNVLEDLELDIAEKQAIINIEKLPVVKGYRRQLQQLFQNLISNAIKYSKNEEAPRIDISANEVTENKRRYHLLEVKDNGIGFEAQYSDKIFQMFTRLHGKSEYSGTGVGLSIVKKVVDNHDGFIKVESTPGEGSKFLVFLPVDRD